LWLSHTAGAAVLPRYCFTFSSQQKSGFGNRDKNVELMKSRYRYPAAIAMLFALSTAAQSDDYNVTAPPADMKLPPFYAKYVDASGYPIVASAQVNDYALKEAAYLVDLMLAKRPDLRKAMVKGGSRLIVIGYSEFTTDIPEYSKMKPKDFWDALARTGRLANRPRLFVCRRERALLSRRSLFDREHSDSRVRPQYSSARDGRHRFGIRRTPEASL
jgi:hypothetical protein